MRPATFALVLAVAGCQAAPPTPAGTPPKLPPAYSEGITGSIEPTASGPGVWWKSFNDATIEALAADGLKSNLDIAQSLARLKAADANVVVAGAGGLPSITFGLADTTKRESGEMKTVSGTVRTSSFQASSSWLIDIFGEVRSQTDSARALRRAALADTDVVRLALLSQIISAYVDARYFQERIQIARLTLDTRRQTLALTRSMQQQGLSSDIDLTRAASEMDAISAELPGYDTGLRKAANRIATLSGLPSGTLDRYIDSSRGQPLPTWNAATGVPADLMRNRPDIRRAENELASSMAEIGVAWAQLFPSLTMSGSITPSYVATSLASGNLTTWSFGPTLRIPIFEGGRLRANVRIAAARAEEKQLAWKSAVLIAVEQVENALVAYNRDQKTVAALRDRTRRAERALNLLKGAFREGLSSQLEVIDADRTLYESQSLLAEARRNLSLNFIALNIAAGRGLPGPGVGQ